MGIREKIYGLASATLVLATGHSVASAAIIRQTFPNFQGSFESVNLPLAGRSIPTGPISARQNPNLTSVATFDTDTNQTIFALHFLLDFPLLHFLGLGELPISPAETGTYRSDGDDLIADVSGQSLITGSSPFAGTETFFQVRWRVTSLLTSSIFEGVIESEIVDICPPASPCVQTVGLGEVTRVPEPSFTTAFWVLGVLGALTSIKKAHKFFSDPETN